MYYCKRGPLHGHRTPPMYVCIYVCMQKNCSQMDVASVDDFRQSFKNSIGPFGVIRLKQLI
jgi:hypothetical protein